MTIEKKDKPTKLNTNRHRKRVRKNINKKKEEAVKKNQERYGHVENGSKVIQRQKSDVSRAPAYRPERLRTGGYHSTYPVREGMLDKEMNQRNLVDSIIKRKQNELSFNAMYKQMAAGDFDKLDDDYKRQVMEVNMQLEKEKKKDKYARELKTAQDNLKTIRSRNIALLDGYLPNHEVVAKDGRAKAARKRDIRTKTEEIKSEIDAEQKKTKVVKTLIDTSDQIQQERIRQANMIDSFKEKFKDDREMLASLDSPITLLAKGSELELQLEEARNQVNNLRKAIDNKRHLEKIDRDLAIAKNELFSTGRWEDSNHAARIAEIYKEYPKDQLRLDALGKYISEEADERRKAYETIEHMNSIIKLMDESEDILKGYEKQYKQKAIGIIRNSSYVYERDKERADYMSVQELAKILDDIRPNVLDEEEQQMQYLHELQKDIHDKYDAIRARRIQYEIPCQKVLDDLDYLLDNYPCQ